MYPGIFENVTVRGRPRGLGPWIYPCQNRGALAVGSAILGLFGSPEKMAGTTGLEPAPRA